MRTTTWTGATFAMVLLTAGFASGQEQPTAALSEGAPTGEVPPPPRPPKDDAILDALTGLGGRGGPGGLGAPGYSVTWYPSRPTSPVTNGTDFGLVRQNLSAPVPLWRDGGDSVRMTVGVQNSLFFTDARLPDSGRAFPDELWNVRLGLNYAHRFDNGWALTVGGNVGSASDKPFHSIDEMNVGFMSSLRVPVWDGRDAWLFSLSYSPLGNLTFPIPGVAYQWNPSDELHVSIGLPLAVTWRPIEDLTLTASYVPLTNVNARATYRLAEQLSLYGGFVWAYEAYFLADRTDKNERFLGYEKRLIGGVSWGFWQQATLDLNAGYAFDRYYGFGQNKIGNLHDQLNVAPGAFIGANVRVRY
jgi:hypothetical protein